MMTEVSFFSGFGFSEPCFMCVKPPFFCNPTIHRVTSFAIISYYAVLMFIDIDGIIYISYNKRNEVSQGEYEYFFNTHKCELVGDINGSE